MPPVANKPAGNDPDPIPPAEDAAELTLTDELLAEIGPIPADPAEQKAYIDGLDIPEAQFVRAILLERERADVGKRIGSNREFLRLMDKTDTLSDDLSEWLETWYPTKAEGSARSKDEQEVSRKNHQAATKYKLA